MFYRLTRQQSVYKTKKFKTIHYRWRINKSSREKWTAGESRREERKTGERQKKRRGKSRRGEGKQRKTGREAIIITVYYAVVTTTADAVRAEKLTQIF